ncbi:MAG: SpoIIE family protein phosphatase [Bacteroidetes bacterium]|nr:SpoIIE family protein phosphatase [Bacteroidota bacterium]
MKKIMFYMGKKEMDYPSEAKFSDYFFFTFATRFSEMKKRILSYYFLLLASNFLLLISASAQRNNFQTYSLEQGLPQATIHCIIQDNRGYLWLGTDGGGICRFDGINFRTYNKKDGFKGDIVRSLMQDNKGRIWAGTKDAGIIIYDGLKFISIGKNNGLAGDAVLCMFQDEDGTVWAGTDNGGLNKISAVKDSFSVEVIGDNKGLSNSSVFDIHKDKDGHLWLATWGGINIISFEKDTFRVDQLRGGREIPSDQIISIAEDNAGALWFGTYDGGVFRLAPKISSERAKSNFKLELLSRKITVFNQSNGFNAKAIWKILKTRSGEMWFASVEDGLLRMKNVPPSDSLLSKISFEKFAEKEGMPFSQTLCVFEDKEKNIWIGSGGSGLCKFMGDIFSHYSEKDGLPANNVQGIDMDSLGTLWFGTSGGGLVEMNLKSNPLVCKSYSMKEGLSGNIVLSVSAGKTRHNKNLWAAVSNAGITKYDGKKFSNYSESQGLLDNNVYSILVDKNGIVWAGSKAGISRFDGTKFVTMDMETMKISNKDVNAIMQDKNGNLWFGTGGGLAKYSGEGIITTFDEAEGLMHKEIKCLAEDPFGNMWIGTNNGGLYRFDVFTDDKKKIRLIANDSLLSSNSVRAIIFLDEKKSGRDVKEMVVGTDKGIDKITFDDKGKILNIRNYNASDGFVGVECNDNAMYRDAGGNIWIGTVKGLTKFNPSAEIQNQNAPLVHITNVKLFFKDVDWKARGNDSLVPWFNLPQSLVLPYSDNHLTFDYAAISLSNSQKVKYRYLLEGADAGWSPDRKETSVTFSALSPGTYTFKVIAAGANGKWNEEPATFKFTITPPWYRTTYAYIAYVILLVGGTYSFVKYRERALIREKKILEDKVIERTAEVVKQKEVLEEQKQVIEEKNKDITDSINYAQKIQEAILPDTEKIKKAFSESFILFQPRDIVSGDFYWFNEAEKNGVRSYMLAAADCTGHGVPGAFMSMINTSLLNEAVNEGNIFPNEILNHARRGIIRSLKQRGEVGEQKDGMDVALISLRFAVSGLQSEQQNRKQETGNWKLEYAGANNSMYIIRKSSAPVLEEIDPDPMPVAISDRTGDFKNNSLELQKGDTFYIFTDGYADQFGGPKGKKFKYSQFKQLLLSMQNKSMNEQHDILKKTMDEWKGTLEQIDDILVIGVRV